MEAEMMLRVTDLSRGGAGVARDPSGRVVFIPFSAPGDLLRVRIVDEDKRYSYAEILEVIEPSQFRQIPRCPAFGQCGGCQWQHISYELQWNTKSQGVAHTLKKTGILLPDHFDLIPATQIWEYRNRVQLRGAGDQLGFYQSKSRNIVSVNRCDIARPEINKNWEQTRAEGMRLESPFKVEVEVLATGKVKRTWNSPHSASGFRQVHDEQNERLKEWISHSLSNVDVLFDLFGGSGNLSLPFVSRVAEIHCVDLSSPKVRPNGVSHHFHFHRAAVTPWLAKKVASVRASVREGKVSSPKNAAILDPPREGLGQSFSQIVSGLESLGVGDLVLVGCDVDAWVRDLLNFSKRGWVIKKVMLLDLFPHTTHVESVALLRRSG